MAGVDNNTRPNASTKLIVYFPAAAVSGKLKTRPAREAGKEMIVFFSCDSRNARKFSESISIVLGADAGRPDELVAKFVSRRTSEVFIRAARKVELFSKLTRLGAGSGVIEGGAPLFIVRPSVEGLAIRAGDGLAI